MPAEIEEFTFYTAYCPECDWESERFGDDLGADDAAEEHNEEAH